MYYHCRPLKFVKYGKVTGNPNPDEYFSPIYRWLGNYCGYFPQVWLSRCDSAMTGYRSEPNKKWNKDPILFCFDNIVGFPVSYDHWCWFMNFYYEVQEGEKEKVSHSEVVNAKIWASMFEFSKELEEDYLRVLQYNSMEEWIKGEMFVNNDQFVLPSLNLKSAKSIICCNEKQKKKLRKLGFIEDRVVIKNLKKENW